MTWLSAELAFWLDIFKEIVHRLVDSMTKTELILFLVSVGLLFALIWILRSIVAMMQEMTVEAKRVSEASSAAAKLVSDAASAALAGLASHERDDLRAFGNLEERLDNMHTDVREIRDRIWPPMLPPKPKEATT